MLITVFLSLTLSLSVPSDTLPVIGQGAIYHDGWIDFNKNGKKDIYEDPSAGINERIEDLLSQMTLEEKTCQMVTLYGYRRVLRDDLPTPEWKNKLWKDGIGAIDEHLNSFIGWDRPPVTDNPYVWPASNHAWALNRVQQFFVEETRLGIPTDFTNEGIRGVESYIATNFPTQLGLGHTWDKELIHQVGYITGREGRLLGYTNIYAPILDVGRDQRWGRYEEVYGESPYLVAELGVEMCRGMQTNFQVASTGKHFIAYSNNKGAREGMARLDPQMSPHEVENVHVYPWKEVIGRAGMLGVMSSYNDYDGFPIQSSKYWLTERLRGDFGFNGYVVSDSDAVEYLHSKHHVSKDMKESVRQAVEAGLNVRCTFRSPDSYVLPLRELIREGAIPMETIDSRVRDILRVKFIVGLFDHPYQLDYEAADKEVNSDGNNEWAKRASRECLVLLKNDGTLPLDAGRLSKIAVIGPNADETGFVHLHYGPVATKAYSVLEGLQTVLEGKAKISYSKGCELVDATWPDSEILPTKPTEEEMKQIDAAVTLAKKSDVAIVVLGGGTRTCGENKSRSSLDLPGRQELLLEKVTATGKPVVLVLINGRPLSVNWAKENVNAILEAWYPGTHGGTAIAEAILGKYNPGGKLTVTFPRTVGQIPFNFPYKPSSQVDGGDGKGPDGRQSRVHGALWEFGYGLSYTTFEYSNLKLSRNVINPDESVEISFDVTNTGKCSGDEIVQLYIHDCISSITVYDRQLRGFERVSLEPGQTKTVKMKLGPKELSLLDKDYKRVVEPGDFDILVGASSQDIRLEAILRVSDGTPEGSKDPNTGLKKYARFPLKLQSGAETILPIKEGKALNYIEIIWEEGTDCRFEIQWTKGGGQFLQAYTGTAKGAGKKRYSFPSLEPSEIKIVLTNGKAAISDITSISIQK